MKTTFRFSIIASFLLVFGGSFFNVSATDADAHNFNEMHCQHFPDDCKTQPEEAVAEANEASMALTESGESIFGALTEVDELLAKGDHDWSKVDFDALWSHLKDMNALMTLTEVKKKKLKDGLEMRVTSSYELGKKAMGNMIPAHSKFMESVRQNWKISYSKSNNGYVITVRSSNPGEVQKIQALGFSGFMVQDNHHAAHHLGMVLGGMTH